MKDCPLLQMMVLIWEKLGYQPHMLRGETKKAIPLQLAQPQRDVVQGIYLFINGNETKPFNKNLTKGLKAGYVYAAYHHLKHKGMKSEIMKMKGTSHFITLLTGSAWSKLLNPQLHIFERDIIKYLEQIPFNGAAAKTWYGSSEQVRQHLIKEIGWRNNNLFSVAEQEYLDSENGELLDEVHRYEIPDVKSKEDMIAIVTKLNTLGRKCAAMKKMVESVISLRIPIYLGSNNREKARNKKKPRATRLHELRNSTGMWVAFQPAALAGRSHVFTPTPTPNDNTAYSHWERQFLHSVETNIANLPNPRLGRLQHSWWSDYLVDTNT
jgi:hypothetical protein